MRTANLLLDAADVTHIGAGAETWEKVVRKLRSGAMPPAGRPRPEPAALDSFVTWLETELDSEAAAHPNPGRVVDHRLNRFEYGNAIRDLLALEIDTDELLPADESDQGFDNIAEVLSMSPTLLGRYMFAARRISQLAVGDPTIGPAVETFNLSRGLRQDQRMNEGLPYGTRGGTLIRHYFPLDGEYLVKIRLGRNFTNSRIRAIRTREEIDVLLDGALVTRFAIGGEVQRRRLRLAALHRERHLPHLALSPDGGRHLGGAVLGLRGHARSRGGVRPQERADRGHGADAAAAAAHELHLRSPRAWTSTPCGWRGPSIRPDRETRRAAVASSPAVLRVRPTRSRARGRFSARWRGGPIAAP